MNNKKKFGQFFTTNYEYILQNLYIPENIVKIIEPFAGDCHLINFIKNQCSIELYDIEPKQDIIIKRDTLINPPDYNNSFIITNPPYLARNKSENKEIYDLYNQNDLYKCFIQNLLTNQCLGGIIIIPLNFFSSIRKADIELRKKFLAIYKIIYLNIFEENVFNDTSYTVCSFQFELNSLNDNLINLMIHPSKNIFNIELNNDNNYTFGGSIYNLIQNKDIEILRLTRLNKNSHNDFITNINIICIDNNSSSKIRMEFVNDEKRFIDKTHNLSARTFACLIIKPKINQDLQKKLIESFNNYLNNHREQYNSLFLCNYRESKDIARKRISFDLVYSITNYLLNLLLNQS